MKWIKRKRVRELRPPMDADELRLGLAELAGNERAQEAVFHLIEMHAVGLSVQAGLPELEASEAKACARAAAELRVFYGELEERLVRKSAMQSPP